MDKIELRKVLCKEEGYEVVEIIINNRKLTEILKEVEKPYAEEEGHPDLAGRYLGIIPKYVFYPSELLFGNPDPVLVYSEGKVTVLDCPCGCYGCWPIEVKISVLEDTVIWSAFEQPHRSLEKWTYEGMRPFIFSREQYESEWKKYEVEAEKNSI